MNKKIILIAVILSVVALAVPVRAKWQSGACKADRQKFCKDVPSGGGAVHKCLEEHKAELSPACKTQMEKPKEICKACKSEKEKFCKDVKPGKGAIRKCLNSHESELSDECRKAMKK